MKIKKEQKRTRRRGGRKTPYSHYNQATRTVAVTSRALVIAARDLCSAPEAEPAKRTLEGKHVLPLLRFCLFIFLSRKERADRKECCKLAY